MFSFKDHVAAIAAKATQRINILKAVCGSSWGHDKETLMITYKALVDSVFSYAAAVWFPNCKPSNVEKLQFIQNSAMRLVTGCHKASSIDHLLMETKMMRVSEHLSMLCAQYLASCSSPSHPSHDLIQLPSGPRTNNQGRPMKETLVSKFGHVVSPLLTDDGIIPAVSQKRAKTVIHTEAVRASIAAIGVNPVLGTVPPPIQSSEESLPRIFRTTLAQLRSGK
jgi:hypothetical protein